MVREYTWERLDFILNGRSICLQEWPFLQVVYNDQHHSQKILFLWTQAEIQALHCLILCLFIVFLYIKMRVFKQVFSTMQNSASSPCGRKPLPTVCFISLMHFILVYETCFSVLSMTMSVPAGPKSPGPLIKCYF